ncbi:uncharacterized protein [Clinocottus analis]|uniref:uncharacterized protein n=1 Tax=Clinocottus analis TaxID=304258 RepID=UPI0035C244DB
MGNKRKRSFTLISSSLTVFHLKMFIFIVFSLMPSVLSRNTALIRFSVPEDHRICLPCAGSDDGSVVIWTQQDQQDQRDQQDQKVVVSRRGGRETNADPRRYLLLPDGGLCLQGLDAADGGTFSCNQRPVAELQVLTGRDFAVSAGRTLLLPCSGSPKPKKRWSQRRPGGWWEVVLTWFRNGTVRPERSRLSVGNAALQIQDLQPEDAGEYQCNGKSQGRLSVLTGHPEPTGVQPTASRTSTAAVVETDVKEEEEEERKKKRPENAVLLVAVVGSALMLVLLGAACALLTSIRSSRKQNYRPAADRREDTELQPWTTTTAPPERPVPESPILPEEAIHYASLGRHNWRERPCRTPPDQNQNSDQNQDQHHVIYSSVVTRPAAKQNRHT